MTDIFPVRYSQPSPTALQKELSNRYSFDGQPECTLFQSGLNDTYQVKFGNDIFYLRISPTNKYIKKDIEEEAEIINLLVKDGYNSVRALTENEMKSLPAFCALRIIWFMGVHMDLKERFTGSSGYNQKFFTFCLSNFKLWYKKAFPEV